MDGTLTQINVRRAELGLSGGMDPGGMIAELTALCRVPEGAQGWAVPGGLLLAGMAGSVAHCVPMCGPFVLGQAADRMARLPAAALCEAARLRGALLLPYHAGRLASYAALGALAAGFGAVALRGQAASLLLALAALLFVAAALRRALPFLPAVDRAPAWWTRRIGRIALRIDRGRWPGEALLGAALGFLPCGFLYAALLAAAASGPAWRGALAMLAFGLGTVPALAVVALAGRAAGLRWQHGVARLAPAVMLFNAAVLALLAWNGLAPAG